MDNLTKIVGLFIFYAYHKFHVSSNIYKVMIGIRR